MRASELAGPRIISSPVGGDNQRFAPWIEIAALVRVEVGDWSWRDEAWVHWAIPVRAGRPVPGEGRLFDPGRRAAAPGAPASERQVAKFELDSATAEGVVDAVLASWALVLYRHRGLGVVSRPGEGREEFRRRCHGVLAPLLCAGSARSGVESSPLAEIPRAIEERRLGGGERTVAAGRIGVGWYPVPIEPTVAGTDRTDLAPMGDLPPRRSQKE